MAFCVGSCQSASLPVARLADPFEDGIDAVTVAFGVSYSLQNHDTNPFTRNHAIGVSPEGSGFSGSGEDAEPGEDHRKVDIRRDVHTANNRQV